MRAFLGAPVIVGLLATWWPSHVAGSSATTAPVTPVPNDGAPIAVQSWLVAGLFPSPDLPNPDPRGPERAGFDADYLAAIGGEVAARPRAGTTVATPDGQTVTFTAYESKGPYADINEVLHSPGNVCAYLYAELESDVEQVVYLHVGTNAAGKAWVGDRLVISHPFDRVAMRSQNVARVVLLAGRTRLLLKVDHDGGGWGAFAEIYGRRAHRRLVAEKFPRYLTLTADRYLPLGGDTVTVSISNWLPPDTPIPISWTIQDDGGERTLGETSPTVKIGTSGGSERVIRIRAEAVQPRGGVVAGECVLLTGGDEAGRRTIRAFEAMAGDPWKLTGMRRDAYALALYAMERARCDAHRDDLFAAVDRVGEHLARLRVALDHLVAGTDPYAGKTGMFQAAYLSEADETAQPFALVVPYGYPEKGLYCLFINLHGASFTHELTGDWAPSPADSSFEEETIIVSVMGRGRYSGYAGLGEDDVVQVIRWVRSHYAIDPDRIYIRGGSMGGFGTWKIASLYPDIFAAAWVDCGGPPLRTLPNLLNLPMYVNQGDADWSVPVTNSRLGVGAMQALGCPVVYTEYPGVDHAVGVAVGPEGYMTRLSVHRRTTDPARIRIVALHPCHAKAYWGRIDRWQDPHLPASLEAEVLPGNVVSVNLSNVARAQLNPPSRHLTTREGGIVWLAGGRRVVTPRSPDGSYDISVTGTSVTVRPHRDEPEPEMRPYAAGSVMNLYRGEPLLIVYGTKSRDDSLRKVIRGLAEEASHWLAPGSDMEFGAIPAAADTEASETLLASKNLLLVGGPEQNSVTARLMPRLPVREEAGSLRIFDSETIPLAGRGYGFVHPNPLQPRRLVFVYGSSVPQFYTLRRGRLLSWIATEMDPFVPDLVIESVARADSTNDPRRNQLVRQLWFTNDWKLKETPNEVITRHPRNALEEVELTSEVYRRAAGAQFALVERGGADEPCSYDTSTVRWQDRPLPDRQIAVFEATGRELLDLATAGDRDWWIFRPLPDSATVDPDGTYHIAGPLEVIIRGPGSRRVSPRNVRLISDEATIEATFREVWGVKRR